MRDNQAIAEHEQELTSLLVRVLTEPLRPLRESLTALEHGLDVVSTQVDKIRDDDMVALQGHHEDLASDLPRQVLAAIDEPLRVSMRDGFAEQARSRAAALDALRAQLAQDLEKQLQGTARGLEARAVQGDDRLEAAVLQLRTVLLERGEVLQQQVVDRLGGFEAAAEQRLARLEHSVAQSDSARRAEEQFQAEWRSRQEEAQRGLTAQFEHSLRASVRPLKFLLAGTFALAVLSLTGLALVAAHLLA
ncbi:MAG: hypothetical protein M0Z99_19000 [Betaproteobacteria bacterium]|nr:hypothetical protein [Betaproteobacteria bacterium]